MSDTYATLVTTTKRKEKKMEKKKILSKEFALHFGSVVVIYILATLVSVAMDKFL